MVCASTLAPRWIQQSASQTTGRAFVRRVMRAPLVLVLAAATFCAQPVAAGPADPPLVDAAKRQDLDALRTLLKDRADVRGRSADGATALHWASHWNDVAAVQLLIAAGADLNAATDTGVTPLSLASINAGLRVVDLLLKAGANPGLARTTGVTPLMEASRSGNVDVVRRLLIANPPVNARETTHGQTALMWAVGEGHIEIMRALLEAGAHVSERTPASGLAGRECCMPNYVGGFTPLLFAVQQGNLDAARLLLSHGADVNETAADGTSALVLAIDSAPIVGERVALTAVAAHGVQEKMAEFLLDNGADPNLQGSGRAPLHSAVQRKMPRMVKSLLAHGANPDARLTKPLPPLARLIGIQNGLEVGPLGATPFWLAASFADLDSMRTLVAGGADTFLTSNDRSTPLMVAAGIDFVEGQDKYGVRWFRPDTIPMQERAIEAVRLCLELGHDINAANDKGQTAMFGAVYFGGTLLAQFLADHHAKLDVVNKRGQTPWLVATNGEYRAGSFYTHKETGELLKRLGADTTIGKDLGRDFARAPSRPQ